MGPRATLRVPRPTAGAGLMNGPILFVAALGWEAKTVLRHVAISKEERHGGAALAIGLVGKQPVGVLTTGVGAARTERALLWLEGRLRPETTIVTGCAGALADGLRRGDVVIASEIVRDDGPKIASSFVWVDRYYRAAAEAALSGRTGRLLTSRGIVGSPAAKREAGVRCRALAVDMESAVVADWARNRASEFLAVRAILDTVSDRLPDLSEVVGEGRIRPAAFLSKLGEAPALLLAVPMLTRAMLACRASLSALHREVLSKVAKSFVPDDRHGVSPKSSG